MMKRLLILVILGSCILVYSPAVAKQKMLSKEELMGMSDLVVKVEVVKVEETDRTEPDMLGEHVRICYATLNIQKIYKGKAENPIIVEFIKFSGQFDEHVVFEVGEKGYAYLKILPNGHYKAAAGRGQGFNLSE